MSELLLGGKKKNDFEKISQGYIQTYLNNIIKKTKQKCNFLYIYRKLDEDGDDRVYRYENDEYPEFLVLNTCGYMFVKKGNEIPILPSFPINEYKTNFVDFNTYFNKKYDANTLIRISPSINFTESHPKLVSEYNYLTKLDRNTKLDLNKIRKDWKKGSNKNINSSLEWFEYISKNCPISSLYKLPYNYYSIINDRVFNKKVDDKDIVIYYDIKSKDEYEIIKDIETSFEDLNQKVTFYETYNNRLKDVIEKCDKKKIKYKLKGDNAIVLKWKDLNSLGLSWNITDFI